MRFMKKFGALALATVTVAASVWYVTPALQALAFEVGQRVNWNSNDGKYTQADDGEYVYTETGYIPYTEWDAAQAGTGSGSGNQVGNESGNQDNPGSGGAGTNPGEGGSIVTEPTKKTPVHVTYTIINQEKGIGIFTNASGSIRVEPEFLDDDLDDDYYYDFGEISFKSQDESIAVISYSEGYYAIIKGVKAGKTTITATVTYEDGKTDEIDIEVRVYDRTSKTVVDASPSSSSNSSSAAPVSAPVKVVAPNGQTLLQYTAIGAKNTLMAAPEGIVPQGAILAQYEVKEDSQTYEVAKTILGLRVPNATLAKVLDFNLSAKQGTLIHQLNGRVAISFDIPANFTVPAGYVPRVYRFNDNGTVTACETILDKGKVVFGTDHFSTFALVLEKAPKAAKAK